ncbi:PLAT domain-containing protein 2-like [Hibiscus syriacus]|uniref:PLAT domain-containing protein 2-like n=1 Tax=Hibiscus syriacus TaxID=106335 RepID=UPI0019223618|nr:PLAT domain-containing protein 2-like [Hibiscus syriacus]
MAIRKQLIFSFFILLSFSTVALADEEDCVYSMYVRTGSIIKGGTDSIISLKLEDLNGNSVEISNLETWGGLMERGYNYFERGNLDIFSGRGR